MHTLIINPNTSIEMTKAIEEVARKYARADHEITATCPEFGPRSIEGFFEEYVAAHAMLDTLLKVRGKYDAIIIACFGDPGLYGAREIMDIPVIGIAEAAFHFACMLGHKFSILVPLPRLHVMMEDLVRFHGLENRLASIRAVELPVLESGVSNQESEKRLIEVGRKAIQEDGAEVLCLGCAGMAHLDKKIEAALGVPVLDGTVCAVKVVEGMHDYGISASKVAAFKFPEKGKEYAGLSDMYHNI